MSARGTAGYLPTEQGRASLARMHARGVTYTVATNPDLAMSVGTLGPLWSGKEPRVHAFLLREHGEAHERALCGMASPQGHDGWNDGGMHPLSAARRLVTCGNCLTWPGWVLAGWAS